MEGDGGLEGGCNSDSDLDAWIKNLDDFSFSDSFLGLDIFDVNIT